MATTDRYVFAKLDGTGWYASNVTDVPAPDPADWQKVVDAVKRGRDAGAPDIAVCIVAGEAAIAAVHNRGGGTGTVEQHGSMYLPVCGPDGWGDRVPAAFVRWPEGGGAWFTANELEVAGDEGA